MTRFVRKTLIAMALTTAFGAGNALAVDASLKTEKDKVSYMVGMQIGNSLQQIKGEVDLPVLFQAIETTLKAGTPLLTAEEAQAVQKSFAERLQAKHAAEQAASAKKNKEEGDAFLASNKGKKGVTTTASGLQYQVVTQGKGPKPAATDTVKVHYTGTLLDGTKFDSSVDRGEPAQFVLGSVVPGWSEALQLMPKGSKFKLWVPSKLGYGEAGTPGGPIPPNSALVFELELLDIAKP